MAHAAETARRSTLGGAALVFAGGVVGTLLRVVVAQLSGPGVGLWSANIVGAAALGLLLAVLSDGQPSLRLLLGTGLLGSFTTYSALAVAIATAPSVLAGLALGLGQVVLGVAAAWLGDRLGRAATGGTRTSLQPDDVPPGQP